MSFNVNMTSGGGATVTPNFGGQPSDAAGQPAGVSRMRQFALKFGGFTCAVLFTALGFVTVISPLQPICIAGGVFQILFGLLLMAVEAPFCYACCPKWEFVGRYEQFVASKPLIVRSVVYVLFGVIVIAICQQWCVVVAVLALWVLAGYYAVAWWTIRKAGGTQEMQGGLVNAENPSNMMQQQPAANPPGGYQPYSAY